ncbi:MAG: metallophosphoesterase [Candidatus Eisenbacteria bacterium]|nr:metallophosphoesterase [Candidatus Eisenbacteria bacterium]
MAEGTRVQREMTRCIFVSDLHGNTERYQKLLRVIGKEVPQAVFLGGDLLPSGLSLRSSQGFSCSDFVEEYLVREFLLLREHMKGVYPRTFVVMGNDDVRCFEPSFVDGETKGAWEYIHNRKVPLESFQVYGYSYVPPTPFLLKDWERYDVSRYVDPGGVSPEEGSRSVSVPEEEKRNATIREDLDRLVGDDNLDRAVFLFHAPPYDSDLDRAALDGKMVDHVPLDLHVGSIAIRRFVETRQPLLTLHGHIHESARLTHSWRQRLGRTHAFSAAHDGSELALVRFSLEDLDSATRELV